MGWFTMGSASTSSSVPLAVTSPSSRMMLSLEGDLLACCPALMGVFRVLFLAVLCLSFGVPGDRVGPVSVILTHDALVSHIENKSSGLG